MPTTTIGIKVDDETRERLKVLSQSKERSPHWLLKKALYEYLEREESKERERRVDEARWERYVLTGEAVEHDEVRKWLKRLSEGRNVERPR